MTRLFDGRDYLEISYMCDYNLDEGREDQTAEFLELGGLKYDAEHEAYLVQSVEYVAGQIEDWENYSGDYQDDEEGGRSALYEYILETQVRAKKLLESSPTFRANVPGELSWGRIYECCGTAYYTGRDRTIWGVRKGKEEGTILTEWDQGHGWSDWKEERIAP